MLEDEKILIERAKGGDSSSFGLLYDHYLPGIYRFVLLRVNHREEAEDITHQTFLKAWENIEQYHFRGYSFGSWLYRIARNTIIDNHRKSNPEISLEVLAPNLLVDLESQSELTEIKIEGETILKALSQLKEVEQEVVIMRFVEELTHREVARIIGKSEGAVKVIQHRALKSLRIILNNGSTSSP